jgi:hypothetical protein
LRVEQVDDTGKVYLHFRDGIDKLDLDSIRPFPQHNAPDDRL